MTSSSIFLAAPRFPSSLLTTLELVEGTSQQFNFSAHANPTPVQYTWQTEDGSDVVFADGISVEAVSLNKWFIVENQISVLACGYFVIGRCTT